MKYLIKTKDKDYILNKINNNKDKINNDKFILIIRLILLIIIIYIIIIIIVIINLKANITNKTKKIIMSNYYNLQTRDIMLDIYSKLLQIYFEFNHISLDSLNDLREQQNILLSFAHKLKEIYHNFTDLFYQYNLDINNNNINSIYDNHKFSKIIGFWEEIQYESRYIEELNIVIYNIFSIELINKNDELIEDSKNFLFFNNKKRINYNQKVESSYIKVLFYFCANYELVYKIIFNKIHDEIKISFTKYMDTNITIYYILEIVIFLFYIIFFIIVIAYLFYSNQVIIRNIIFLFLDFSQEENNNNMKYNDNHLLILKLMEFQNIIDDFDLNRLKKYKKKIDAINKKQTTNEMKEDIISQGINNIKNNYHNQKEINDEKRNNAINDKSKYNSTINRDEKNNKILKKEEYKKAHNTLILSFKGKGKDNSSFQHLLNYSTNNSNILKEKLNNNNNNNNNININNIEINENKNNILKNSLSENFQNKILNKTYLIGVFIIKIFLFIILFSFLIILIHSSIKIKYLFSFVHGLNNIFHVCKIISDRFSFLIYFFNIFRTLIIFHDEQTRNSIEPILDNINNIFDEENDEYTNFILYHNDEYQNIKNLLQNLTYNGDNSSDILFQTICSKEQECKNYLRSKYNLFDAGFYYSYKSCFSYVSNFYKDYKNINNKTNIEEIKKIIINNNTLFNSVSLGISHLIYYVKNNVYECFEMDLTLFLNNYNKNLDILNIASIIISFFIILFINVFVLITISKYISPLRDSAYRINRSFYYIKNYRT